MPETAQPLQTTLLQLLPTDHSVVGQIASALIADQKTAKGLINVARYLAVSL